MPKIQCCFGTHCHFSVTENLIRSDFICKLVFKVEITTWHSVNMELHIPLQFILVLSLRECRFHYEMDHYIMELEYLSSYKHRLSIRHYPFVFMNSVISLVKHILNKIRIYGFQIYNHTKPWIYPIFWESLVLMVRLPTRLQNSRTL